MRKSLTMIMLFLMVAALLTGSTANVQASGTTSDSYTYTVADNQATITGYTGTQINLVIPTLIEGVSVTGIGIRAFYMRTELLSVTIPFGVKTIRDSAFSGCKNLTSVSIPSSVNYIEESAFSDCSSLTSVNIPSGVTTIEYRTFAGCTSLTSVTIPSSVTWILNGAFAGCVNLKKIIIPSSVTYIGADSGLKNPPVTIHGSTGSYAHTYAQENNIPFEVLGQIMRGDANDDKKIDIMDLVAIIDYIVSGIEPISKINADANASGDIDIMDLVWIIDVIVGS
ncbi:MAG: leucine-rich repeat protein [Clostridiales bacterium]|nr:leucine-rich repeat protein [Clostridiales bacterium]